MMIFNISGGGGTALNFRVVKNPQPSNPSENCIWVNTDVDIQSWIFSVEEPSPAEAGMVWFPTGTISSVPFNALKKNGIQVYPLSAKQYVGGAWVDKEAKSYQGGEWVDWIVWLFKENEGFKVPFTLFSQGNASLTANDSYIESTYRANYASITNAGTEELIDITNISEIVVEIECTAFYDTYKPMLYISTTKVDSGGNVVGRVAQATLDATSQSIQKLKLSTKEFDGEYYVGLWGIANYKAYNWYMR